MKVTRVKNDKEVVLEESKYSNLQVNLDTMDISLNGTKFITRVDNVLVEAGGDNKNIPSKLVENQQSEFTDVELKEIQTALTTLKTKITTILNSKAKVS